MTVAPGGTRAASPPRRPTTDAILAIDGATPEQRLLAALVLGALRDAERGDAEARRWLARHGPGVLAYLVPPGVDVAALLRRVVA